MRTILLLAISTLPPLTLSGQQAATATPAVSLKPGMLWGTVIKREEFKPLTGQQRWDLYWRQTFWTPGVYFRAAAIGALDQNKNIPSEWGQGWDAYSKRVANDFGRAALQDTFEAGGAALLHEDVRYIRCGCKGWLRRTGYAIGTNFVTLNRNGHWEPAYARLGSAVGAEYLANTWMPDGYRNWNTSLRDGALQFAFGGLFNILREFAPLKSAKTSKPDVP